MLAFDDDDDLIGILYELQQLTSIINNETVGFLKISQIMGPIQYRLLSFQSADSESSQNAVLREVCCIGASVHLKIVYDFHLRLWAGAFPAGALMDRAMIQKIKSCLDMADTATAQTSALFLWLMFLGGIAVAGTKERAWFVARIARTIMDLQICSWKDARSSLIQFLWVDRIHENACRDLWDEALITVTVLFGRVC